MKRRTLMSIAALVLAALGGAAAAADVPAILDVMKAVMTPNQIVFTQSVTKDLYAGEAPREYRVCVKNERHSAPMRILADGQALIVHPGGCEFVKGTRISATPARPLGGGARIVATFRREKPDEK